VTVRRIAGAGVVAAALVAALAGARPDPGRPAAEGRRAGYLTGQLLVARPEMNDPRFSRSVVFVVRHDAAGALGLIVNRPLEKIPIALLLRRLGLPDEGVDGSILVHYGGPVEPGRVFILHTADYRGEGTQVIADGIALSGSPAVLRAIAAGKGPRRALLFLSYSGWAPGQLEREIEAGGWLVARADPALVFDDDHETKWDRALGRRGIDL
jgi:putative transcriptional regulator